MDSLKYDHGSERDVSLCQYSTRHDCTASEAAGLICKGRYDFSYWPRILSIDIIIPESKDVPIDETTTENP